jgi:hypothetical protein
MIGLDLFPIRFFEIRLDQVDAFNVLNEILRKEEDIRLISSTRQTQSATEYITDYPYQQDDKIVELESISSVFDKVKNTFEENNSTIDIGGYWTAIYSKTAHHGTHDHSSNILDRINYSGILYLTDIGSTTFYSTNPSSFENRFYSKSEVGKILIFPSTIPHSVEPTLDESKRVVVAFNCEIRNK